MADGQLDIMFLEGSRRLRLARFLLEAWLGNAGTGDWIHRLRVREMRVEGPSGVPVQADGELIGGLPLKIDILDRAFPLVVPRKR
jgi:diacylglycerol kinase family enzyme